MPLTVCGVVSTGMSECSRTPTYSGGMHQRVSQLRISTTERLGNMREGAVLGEQAADTH